MRLVDTRPPFAGLANLSEGALASLPTPCYLLDEAQLRRNGEILLGVQQRTGCKILLAQKAFSNFDLYPLLAPCLAGTEASGLYESRLGKEELPEKENHVFCAAYRVDEFNELLDYADHIVFNSPGQLAKFGPAAKAAGKSVGPAARPQGGGQAARRDARRGDQDRQGADPARRPRQRGCRRQGGLKLIPFPAPAALPPGLSFASASAPCSIPKPPSSATYAVVARHGSPASSAPSEHRSTTICHATFSSWARGSPER